jgi:hypothetical protein
VKLLFVRVRAARHGQMIKGPAAQGYQRTCGAGPSTSPSLRSGFAQDDSISCNEFFNEFQDDGIYWSRILEAEILAFGLGGF